MMNNNNVIKIHYFDKLRNAKLWLFNLVTVSILNRAANSDSEVRFNFASCLFDHLTYFSVEEPQNTNNAPH